MTPPPLHLPSPGLCIFLVEDDSNLRNLLRFYLEHLGHLVIVTSSLAEAISRWPAAGCQMLISDIQLPDGNGCDLPRQLPSPSPLYVVAMSGNLLAPIEARSKAGGFHAHLEKPFSLGTLAALLQAASATVRAKTEHVHSGTATTE